MLRNRNPISFTTRHLQMMDGPWTWQFVRTPTPCLLSVFCGSATMHIVFYPNMMRQKLRINCPPEEIPASCQQNNPHASIMLQNEPKWRNDASIIAAFWFEFQNLFEGSACLQSFGYDYYLDIWTNSWSDDIPRVLSMIG